MVTIFLTTKTILLLAAVLLPACLIFATALIVLLEQVFSLEKKLKEKEKLTLEQAELTDQVRQKLEEKATAYVQKELALFAEELAKMNQATLALFNQQERGLLQATGKELDGLKGTLQDNLKDGYQKMLLEVAAEKKRRLEELEKELPLLTEKVIEEVLGKFINMAEHEELILAALGRAKRQGVFS
ncbi:hypothetical protein FJZ40_00570 [Candidatus Shapirobacteria bacterium]|nr:hypothetical protein [Candidatus Shapirobacteria bacterium]